MSLSSCLLAGLLGKKELVATQDDNLSQVIPWVERPESCFFIRHGDIISSQELSDRNLYGDISKLYARENKSIPLLKL